MINSSTDKSYYHQGVRNNKCRPILSRLLVCLGCCLFLFSPLRAQDTVEVTENTMKVGAFATEEFYSGFAEGDQLLFDFEELKGKELKELEILEWPSTSRFMDYKTTKISGKTLLIQRTGIYKFRLYNSAMGGRICKVHLRRVPASSVTKGFNTNVYNRVIYDTTYITEQERYLVRADTTFSTVTDQRLKVHSSTNPNGNKTYANFVLPPNTVAWSYFIGVDQAGQKAWEQATNALSENTTSSIA